SVPAEPRPEPVASRAGLFAVDDPHAESGAELEVVTPGRGPRPGHSPGSTGDDDPVTDTSSFGATGPGGAYARLVRPALGALLVGLLTPPVAVLAAVVAAVQLAAERSPRRILFVQERAGRHGRPFRMIKFRTLREGAGGALVPTRLGAILRRTHLDELPQLWNVWRGEMALIGPRPESMEVEAWAESRVPGFGERLAIAPGITGLAQVVQDSTPLDEDLYREKLRLNRLYLARMSLAVDVRILARTALRPLRPRHFGQPAAPLTAAGRGSTPSSNRAEPVDAPSRRSGLDPLGATPCRQTSPNPRGESPAAPGTPEGTGPGRRSAG
ncbi:MAG: sugar transferase, partial [Planctomycetota bacterium]